MVLSRRTLMGTGLALGAVAARQTIVAPAQAAMHPILLIGATAKCAPEILIQALTQGRHVTAIARRTDDVVASLPENLRNHPALKVVKGDAYVADSLAQAMTGKEAVISVIAPRVNPRNEQDDTSVDLYSVGTANILFAMLRKGNRRFICVSSGGTEVIPDSKPPAEERIRSFVWHERGLYQDMIRMEKIVAGSGLDYVILRPRTFVKGPARHDLKMAIGEPMEHLAATLTYADFTDFVLQACDNDTYLRKTVGLYTDQNMPG